MKYQSNISSATWDTGSDTKQAVRTQKALAKLCGW